MSKTNREQFEAWLVSEYYWANDTLNCANFIGDDETGYYIGGDYIYDGGGCGEPLFWAWRGWQASKTKSEAQLTALTSQLESVVAENAALSKFIDDECYVYGPHDVEPVDAALEKPETPATDEFLAEVRASGVDEVCLKISNAIVNCYQDEQVGLDAAATVCGDFAAQIRQEAK